MAKKYFLILLLPFCMLLSACPYESAVPLAAHPVEPVDSTLLGYWYGIVKDGSDFFGIEALDIKKQSDSIYAITRYGKAVKGDIILPDTAYFTGYTSWVDSQRFFNIEGSIVSVDSHNKKKPVVTTQKVFYAAAIQLNHDTLDVRTVTETFTARKDFHRPEEFRDMVSGFLTNQKNIYDDQYSLKYKKTIKPAHY